MTNRIGRRRHNRRHKRHTLDLKVYGTTRPTIADILRVHYQKIVIEQLNSKTTLRTMVTWGTP